MSTTWDQLPADVESYLRNVRVKNVGEKDAVLYFNSVPYIVRAGDQTTMPFEAVCIWLGDPRAGERAQVVATRGEPAFVPSRDDEIVRLRLIYGMHGMGGSHEILSGTDPETGAEVDYPRMEVTSGNDERLYTVLEDPKGTHGAIPVPATVSRHEQERDETIRRLTAELEMLKERAVKEDAGLIPSGQILYTHTNENDLPRDEAPDPSAPIPSQRPADNLDFDTTTPKQSRNPLKRRPDAPAPATET